MDPCNVCGGTDTNLVDGYYYCVECGTQDVNVRETVVEQTVLGDRTFAHTTSRKITAAVQNGIEMSSEWHKWHIFNFILVGLTDELIALGARPTFKMKVLWIWTRYVKQFQVKDDLQSKNTLGIENDNDNDDDDALIEDNNENDGEESCNDNSDHEYRSRKSMKSKSEKNVKDMKTITKGTILTILYVALNLDRSDIQLSHLFRFIREGRLSLYDCMKYVPKELKLNTVKDWKSFTHSLIEYNPISIRGLSLTFFKILNLGVPLVPDLRKLVKNFVQELCLPSNISDLVFALIHFMPVDFLDIDAKIQKTLVRIPDYEGVCMAYILIALKMCFGLDDDYEQRLSKEIDKINEEENLLKSYKLGLFSEPCDRLFSCKEWFQHLQFRKHILCKNYLPMSRQYNSQTNDYIFMEHREKKKKREVKLSDNVIVDILNKIESVEGSQIIPKNDFPATLTPMSTYMDVIAQRVDDPDLRLLLCEDFTQYSLGYAVKDFKLPVFGPDLDNPIKGVCESGKIFNKNVIGTLVGQEGDMTMVYVRNCQNKNWLKTEPPKMHHVTKVGQNESSSDKESDHGYDSNIENSNPESDTTHVTISNESVYNDKVLEVMQDLVEVNKCIFDDNFLDIPVVSSNNSRGNTNEQVDQSFEFNIETNLTMQNSPVNSLDNIENCAETEVFSFHFDPNTFDKDEIIKELIEIACKKYKITIPKVNTIRKQTKRKVNLADNGASSSEPKKKRTLDQSKSGEAKHVVDNFISAYYNTMHNDILNELTQQVKSIIEDVDNINNLDALNVSDGQDGLNESSIMNRDDNINSADISYLKIEETENLHTEIDTNDSLIEAEQNHKSVAIEENVEEEISHEQFPKSDPMFDEKEHDIRQLYVRLGEDTDMAKVSISDISNDPEIDRMIQNQIERFSNIDKSTLAENKKKAVTDEIDNVSDSDDDVPLSVLKESTCFEREKEERKKEKLKPFIRDPSSVKTFNYWVRQYKSRYVIKSRDVGKKFDLELNENLPASFVFVIRECAVVLGCSMFSLYKHMQNIEEILIANVY